MVSKIREKYKCDRQSKYDFTASTIAYIEKLGKKNIHIEFYEVDKDKNIVDFDSPYADTTSRSDLIMMYNNRPMKIELKERWGKYVSDYYGKPEDKEGWMLNIDKKEELLSDNRFIPLYANLYPDNVVRVWNFNKVERYDEMVKDCPQSTVEEKDKKPYNRLGLFNNESIAFERVKGYPSNGKWSN